MTFSNGLSLNSFSAADHGIFLHTSYLLCNLAMRKGSLELQKSDLEMRKNWKEKKERGKLKETTLTFFQTFHSVSAPDSSHALVVICHWNNPFFAQVSDQSGQE